MSDSGSPEQDQARERQLRDEHYGATLAERLDAAESGDDFALVLQAIFGSLERMEDDQ